MPDTTNDASLGEPTYFGLPTVAGLVPLDMATLERGGGPHWRLLDSLGSRLAPDQDPWLDKQAKIQGVRIDLDPWSGLTLNTEFNDKICRVTGGADCQKGPPARPAIPGN